jgi:polyisoprenoid-binding protein YceI
MSSPDVKTTAIDDLTGDYDIDPAHSRVGFVARHAMVTKVRGEFPGTSGRIHLDAQDPSRSSAEVTVDIASVKTGQDARDEHLKGSDFFDAEQFPQMTFSSKGAESAGGDDYRLTGDLTIRGVTQPVTLELEYNGSAKDIMGNLRVGFEGHTTINRKDWGLSWNAALETGGFMVSDKIRLELDISAIRVAAAD